MIVLNVGNMRNIVPYEGNSSLDFFASMEPFGTILLIIAALTVLFMTLSFFTVVLPELLGKKDVFQIVESRGIKKEEEKKQNQIEQELKKTKEFQVVKEKVKRLNSKAEREVLMRGYTKETWLLKLKKDFEKTPYSTLDEKTKELIWNKLKDGWIIYNEKLKEDFLKYNQGDLFDIKRD
jgi:hypothetical protein